jgi:hypothetical protein
LTVATSKKIKPGRPAPAYVHRSASDWMRPSISKLAYRSGRPIKPLVRYHNRTQQRSEVPPSTGKEQNLTEEFAATFQDLASQWREETKAISAIEETAMHPAYQRIIGMGPAAIPHIMRALEHSPDNWFWALRAITGADPVQPDERGRMSAMGKAWIAWAHANHIDW